MTVEIKIGNQSLKGHGRADIHKWEDKHGNQRERKGYSIKLDPEQPAYGGGNIFIRA